MKHPHLRAKTSNYARRKRRNLVAMTLSWAAMAFGLFWLMWILWTTVRFGINGLTLATFTQTTPAPHELGGGLANALFGSAAMVLVGTALGTLVGVMTGIYLAEYNPTGKLASVTRFVNDTLLSAPSIVIGLFVYVVVVARFKSFSGWAGALALALIVLPIVLRATENMLQLVPQGMREAAYALGASKSTVIRHVTLRAARVGLVTGVLLGLSRAAGETAPLLFTALSNQFWNTNMARPMASLPVTIFQFAMSPYENWQNLAWAGVLLITAAVLGLNILARMLTRKT